MGEGHECFDKTLLFDFNPILLYSPLPSISNVRLSRDGSYLAPGDTNTKRSFPQYSSAHADRSDQDRSPITVINDSGFGGAFGQQFTGLVHDNE